MQSAAVGQKIIYDQNAVVGGNELFGNDDLIGVFVGEGFHGGDVHITINIHTFGFFGKHHGYVEIFCNSHGDCYAGCFDGEYLGDVFICKTSVKLLAHFIHEIYVDLMVQKGVNFQHVAGLHNAVLCNSFFQTVHTIASDVSIIPHRLP